MSAVKGSSGANVVLEIHEATGYAGKPLQVTIGNGSHGYRLAGPKFAGAGSRLLRRVEIDAAAAKAIRSYLDEVE